MKFIFISLFLLGLQGCATTDMWVGNVYGDNDDILWSDVFINGDRCKEKTANMVSEFEYTGARSWDCIPPEKVTPQTK